MKELLKQIEKLKWKLEKVENRNEKLSSEILVALDDRNKAETDFYLKKTEFKNENDKVNQLEEEIKSLFKDK